MSVHASKWAWGQDCPSAPAKLVLMALADHANGDGECWPTMNLIAELVGVKTRTVHDHVKALEDAGLVERVERRMYQGQFRGWTYRLNMDATSGATPPVADDRQRRETTTTSGGTPQSPPAVHRRSGTVSEPSVNHQGRKKPGRRRDELFEAVVEVCGLELATLTKNERGKANNATGQLREVGATPDEVRGRASAYRRKFDRAELTPQALANNWSQLVAGSRPKPKDLCKLCRRSLSASDHDDLCEVFR